MIHKVISLLAPDHALWHTEFQNTGSSFFLGNFEIKCGAIFQFWLIGWLVSVWQVPVFIFAHELITMSMSKSKRVIALSTTVFDRSRSHCQNGNHCLKLKMSTQRIHEHTLRKNSDVYSRSTRNCNLNLLCPSHRNASEGGCTFAVRTIKDWNSLPRSLKTEKSVKSAKAKLCNTFLNSQKTNGIF